MNNDHLLPKKAYMRITDLGLSCICKFNRSGLCGALETISTLYPVRVLRRRVWGLINEASSEGIPLHGLCHKDASTF
jgi:hypothetical protein